MNKNSAHLFLSEIKSVLPSKMREGNFEDLNHELLNNPALIHLMKASPAAIAIFSYASMSYEYFSPNMADLINYPLEKLKGMSGAEFALNIFNPEHRVRQ